MSAYMLSCGPREIAWRLTLVKYPNRIVARERLGASVCPVRWTMGSYVRTEKVRFVAHPLTTVHAQSNHI